MQINDYQKKALRTACKDMLPKDRINIAVLGLAGEAGEVADAWKKVIGHGHELDIEHLRSELGDVAWYLAEICSVLGWSLEHVLAHNIEKLKRRYPDGFSE